MVSRRRLAPVAALLALVSTAACGSGTTSTSGSPSGGGAPTASQPLAPFVGAFAGVALPAGIQSLQDVDCPSAIRCWAVGSTLGTGKAPSAAAVVTTTTGGATWTVQPVPPTVGYLTGIACPTTRSCTAVGQMGTDGAGPGAVLTTVNAGATWTLQVVPAGTSDVTAVACPSAGRCTALGNVAGRVTTLAPGAPGTPWVVGGALPATVASATGLSCLTVRRCWATVISPVDVGHATGAVATTTDGGATWTTQSVPPGTGALQGIDCTATDVSDPTGSTSASSAGTARVACAAVGTTATATGATRTGQGLVLTTTTGGVIWTQASVTAASAALLAVSCGAGPCVAVGSTVPTAPQAGLVLLTGSPGAGSSGWRKAAVAAVPLPLTGVSCRSLSSCVVVGESVSAHLTAG